MGRSRRGASRRRAAARSRLRGAALALRCGALLALAALLAGPVGVHRAPPEPGLGLDLTLVLDASGSMRALDAQLRRRAGRTRLDLAREVVARFATQRAAEGDRVALVVFGDTAFTLCPLSSDGALLARALERVEPGMAGEATALGQALALAVKRARGAGDPGRAPGRVVVLLTDGRHNAGALSVEVATQLAAAAGVRVHTVGIGSVGRRRSRSRDPAARCTSSATTSTPAARGDRVGDRRALLRGAPLGRSRGGLRRDRPARARAAAASRARAREPRPSRCWPRRVVSSRELALARVLRRRLP